MRRLPFAAIIFIVLCAACNSANNDKNTLPLTKEDSLKLNIQTLKDSCKEGDLLVRLSDELISERIRYLNEKDFSFSHAGVIVMHNNQKMVCNINPDFAGADTIRFEPIDSFINPKKNIVCGLYRYNLPPVEIDAFVGELNRFHKIGTRFDNLYDLATDSTMYCTEMIYKALKKSAGDNINIKTSLVPQKAIQMVAIFFKGKIPKEEVAKRPIISLDNLYLNPICREVMRFKLKIFPGE